MKAVTKILDSIRAHPSDVSVALFVVAGIIGALSQAMHPASQGGEMMSLAKNIAEHGTFANPFRTLATGPTAVNPPLYPFLLAGLMKLLRLPFLVYGAAVLGSVLANALTAALLPRVSDLFYGDVIPGVIGSVLWMTAMPEPPGWDTSYTIAALLLFCLLTATPVGPYAQSIQRAAGGGVIAGVLFLLNPASQLISVPWIGYLLWQSSEDLKSSFKYCGTILAVLCVFAIGWCGRNYHELGAFVVRTNLGMTLYVSNNDCAQSSVLRDALNGCYQALHPNESIREAELLRNMGEVQYDRSRIAATMNWIGAHPAKFVKLTMERALEFWFPPVEAIPEKSVVSGPAREWLTRRNRVSYAIWVITALSVPGLILMYRRREPVLWFVLAVMAIYPLLYYVVVSDIRYRYPVLWLSALPAGYFIRAVLEKMSEPSKAQVAC